MVWLWFPFIGDLQLLRNWCHYLKSFQRFVETLPSLPVQHYRKQSALEILRWFSWCFSAETTSKPPLRWEECLSCWQRSERSAMLSSICTTNFEIYNDKINHLFFLFFFILSSTVSRLLHGNEVGVYQLEWVFLLMRVPEVNWEQKMSKC